VHLASLPRVRQAAVVAECRDGHAESLHAFVVLAGDAAMRGCGDAEQPGHPERAERVEGSAPSRSALEIGASIRKELAAQIPTYMLPRKVHVLEQLPLTPNGKTDRRALAARVQAPSA
jgi:D-alanine--poly(phosphoribitol) ligase subunit 1